MHELYDVRLALEDLTVRRATNNGDREILYALKTEWERLGELRKTAGPGEQPDFVAADEAFHLGVASASGNDAAKAYLTEITERIHVLRIQGFTIESRVDATVDEHLEILEAMLSGDADVAAGFMRAHVLRNAQVVRTLVGEALSRMFATR
jgi:DNA-binding GntR family transcriptional regulator